MNIFFFISLCFWFQTPAESFLPVVPSITNQGKGITRIDTNHVRCHRLPGCFALSLKLEEGDSSDDRVTSRVRSTFSDVWPIAISIFIANNYFRGCWPAALAEVPFTTLNFVHAVSGMLFAGCIITTTVLEWMVVESGSVPTQRLWFDKVPIVEEWIVLPALTGSIVSGIGNACIRYGSFQMAPFHVQSTLFLLLAFGLWWGFTDRTTQARAQFALENSLGEKRPTIFQLRRISNVVSCLFLLALYGMMIFKPGIY